VGNRQDTNKKLWLSCDGSLMGNFEILGQYVSKNNTDKNTVILSITFFPNKL